MKFRMWEDKLWLWWKYVIEVEEWERRGWGVFEIGLVVEEEEKVFYFNVIRCFDLSLNKIGSWGWEGGLGEGEGVVLVIFWLCRVRGGIFGWRYWKDWFRVWERDGGVDVGMVII